MTSIGLISGVLSDQQHWQRAFTIKARQLRTAYIVSGILFGIVPISLSVLGFLGANPAVGATLPSGVDPSMIGVAVIAKYLPAWAAATFAIMLLCGLCATLDSGLCAAGSLYAVNLFPYTEAERRVQERERMGQALTAEETDVRKALDRKVLTRSRRAMTGITIAGLLVALAVLYIPGFGLQYLWWIFNTIAACVAVPTVLSLYWNRLDGRGVVRGVIIAFVLGIPLFVYANYKNLVGLTVGSSVGIIAITTISCLTFPRAKPFDPITAADDQRVAPGR